MYPHVSKSFYSDFNFFPHSALGFMFIRFHIYLFLVRWIYFCDGDCKQDYTSFKTLLKRCLWWQKTCNVPRIGLEKLAGLVEQTDVVEEPELQGDDAAG